MPLLKPNAGRALSAIGAVVVVLALFMVWYHLMPRDESSTGWQTFTNLRFVIVAGGVLTLLSALVPQTRLVLTARTLLGLLLAALILRRIIFPPDLVDTTVTSQVGVYVGFVGALLVAAGGLVDTGRKVVEVYPNLWRPPVAELGRGQRVLDSGDEPSSGRRR
jgi:peptidoglycan/LPS O-acetylase OafA/YrhL